MSMDIFTTDNPKWDDILNKTSCDFYHTAAYHKLHENGGSDRARLFVYQVGSKIVAIPLILRPLNSVDALADDFPDYYDATSVYGYAGPITNHTLDDRAFFEDFSRALADKFHELKIISAFTRLHPILENDRMITVGDIIQLGQTISIDLSQPEDIQFKKYRSNHKRNIKKALKNNIEVYRDEHWEDYEDFIQIYNITMDRVEAADSYYFEREYFDNLRTQLDNIVQLFVVKLDDVVLSAGLFMLYDGIIQYHLGASDPKGMQYASSKLMMDGVRRWGNSIGANVFHLGGGLGGSNDDSLFRFKAGFSDQQHLFKIWNFIADNNQYQLAVDCYENWLTMQETTLAKSGFFPIYRAPIIMNSSS